MKSNSSNYPRQHVIVRTYAHALYNTVIVMNLKTLPPNATGAKDAGGKFAAGVNHTGGKLATVSTTGGKIFRRCQ
jgi:hypothetical protein